MMEDKKVTPNTGTTLLKEDDLDNFIEYTKCTVISVGVGIGKLGEDYLRYMQGMPLKYINISSESDILSLDTSLDKEDVIFLMVDWENAVNWNLAFKVAEHIPNCNCNIGIFVQDQPCTNDERDVAEANAMKIMSKMGSVLRLEYDFLKGKAEELSLDVSTAGIFYAWLAVKSITQIELIAGLVNVDHKDIMHIMNGAGNVFMGFGEAQGEYACESATKKAIDCLSMGMPERPKRVLLCLAAKEDFLPMVGIDNACKEIYYAYGDLDVIFSATPCDDLSNMVQSVIFASTSLPNR